MNTVQILESCQEKLKVLETMVPVEQYQKRLEEIDGQLNGPDLWNNPRAAAALMKERSKLAEIVNNLTSFKDQVQFYQELAQIAPVDLETEGTNIFILHSQLADTEFKQIMNNPVDDSVAILSISAGAGGLEAANWVSMLLRMYTRYATAHGFKLEILDLKPSEEHSSICIDSVSIQISGPYAFGYMKGEAGVHRLIRNSPFNAADARQTSFAAVAVLPDIEDSIDIKIEDKDLEITTMRASGSGGQAVNKIESAVRMKHLPTGLIVNSRAQSSQHANRRFAMKMMKAKLYDYELKKQQEASEKQVENLSDISFGHQIRTYTMTPYSLVTDHRTDYKKNNADSVLDGDLEDFLLSYLRNK
jgi:peptide chain release factor 2